MCEIVDGFISQGISQGEARTLIRCVESLMETEDINVSEACEKLGYELNDYENAHKLIQENA